MTELPDYGSAMFKRGERPEFIFQDFPVKYVLKIGDFFTTATEARIESVDYAIQLAFDSDTLGSVGRLAPAESADRVRVWAAVEDPTPLFFQEAFPVAFCAVLPTVPAGCDVEKIGTLPFVVRGVFPPNQAPFFGTGKARSTKPICFSEEAKTVPMRWLKNNAEAGVVIDPPRLWKNGLIRVVSAGAGRVKPEIWNGTTWVSGRTLVDADRGVPADSATLLQFGVSLRPSVCPSGVDESDQSRFPEPGDAADEPDLYILGETDRDLLRAAALLLKKVAGHETLRPAQLVSVAKLQHALSRLPRSTPDVDVRVGVVGPRHNFGQIETWHYWDVGIEGKRLFLATGGHFYQPSTGGDCFTTMNWEAVPGETTNFEDYRETLWIVPDVQTFEDGVAGIDFTSGVYRLEIFDSDNPFLNDEEVEADAPESNCDPS